MIKYKMLECDPIWLDAFNFNMHYSLRQGDIIDYKVVKDIEFFNHMYEVGEAVNIEKLGNNNEK